MADNSGIKQHVSIDERLRWDKVIQDFGNHLGAGGPANHKLGNGSVAGFSTNDYTNGEKDKLSKIQDGALNNPHPATHPHTIITGLHQVASSGNYHHLNNIPLTFIAGGGNSDTVGGIRFTIAASAPANPQNNKDIWINTTNLALYVYTGNTWVPTRAAYA